MLSDDELIERLREKRDGDTTGWDVLDFIHASGSCLDALLYGRLFWPKFVEFASMVFLKETTFAASDQARVRDALVRYGNDRKRTEESFNFTEVPHLFGTRIDEAGDVEYLALAMLLAETWRARLRDSFPSRRCEVAVLPADNGTEVGIVFWTI